MSNKNDAPPAYSGPGPQQPQPAYQGYYPQGEQAGYYQPNPQMGYYQQPQGPYPGQQYPPQGQYYGQPPYGQQPYGPPGQQPYGYYQDRNAGGFGFCEAMLASLACCCCLDMCLMPF